MATDDTREKLADYAHEAWSGWMRYMFSKCGWQHQASTAGPLESAVIPHELVERWQRQMSTSYAYLPEAEKKSDRDEADKMLAIIAGEK